MRRFVLSNTTRCIRYQLIFLASLCAIAVVFSLTRDNSAKLNEEVSEIAYSLRLLERVVRRDRHIFEQREPGNVELLPNLWGPREKPLQKKKGIFAISAGASSHSRINSLVQQVGLDDFSFIIFHYDSSIEEWLQYAWYKKVASVRAVGQAKYWFAKRFLGASVVENYRYVFLWDDDWDTSRFDAHRYVEILDRFNIHFSQPAQVGSGIHYREVQEKQDTKYGRWTSFVEIGAHVFSVDAWLSCVHELLQGDITLAWSFDYSFPRVCARLGYCRMAVIDPYPLEHLDTRSMSGSTLYEQKAREESAVLQAYFQHGRKCLCPNEWVQDQEFCQCGRTEHRSIRPITETDAGRTDCSSDIAPSRYMPSPPRINNNSSNDYNTA